MPKQINYTTIVATKITDKTNETLKARLKFLKMSKYEYLRTLIEIDLNEEHIFAYNIKNDTMTEDINFVIAINKNMEEKDKFFVRKVLETKKPKPDKKETFMESMRVKEPEVKFKISKGEINGK